MNNFNLRDFIKKGLLDAVGKMADYQIILNAAGWYDKGVLTREDLAEINTKIDEKNTPAPTPEENPDEDKPVTPEEEQENSAE